MVTDQGEAFSRSLGLLPNQKTAQSISLDFAQDNNGLKTALQ